MIVAKNFFNLYRSKERDEIYQWCRDNSIKLALADENFMHVSIEDEYKATLFMIRWSK